MFFRIGKRGQGKLKTGILNRGFGLLDYGKMMGE